VEIDLEATRVERHAPPAGGAGATQVDPGGNDAGQNPQRDSFELDVELGAPAAALAERDPQRASRGTGDPRAKLEVEVAARHQRGIEDQPRATFALDVEAAAVGEEAAQPGPV